MQGRNDTVNVSTFKAYRAADVTDCHCRLPLDNYAHASVPRNAWHHRRLQIASKLQRSSFESLLALLAMVSPIVEGP